MTAPIIPRILPAMQWLLLAALAQERFRLDNGFEAILEPADTDSTVIALAFTAGVHHEPEGKQGVAHLTEHLFHFGGGLGDLGMERNAETMWTLTYFYAVSPHERVADTLGAFAEAMSAGAFTPSLLERERPRVLQEIEFARPHLEAMKAFARRPKAGIREHVEAMTIAEIEAFRANHYRPDRALLLVMGRVDGVRESIERLFGPLQPRPPVRQIDGPSDWSVLDFPCPTPAARVAAHAWKRKMEGRAYVEWLPPDRVRLVLEGSDLTPALEARDALFHPLSRADLGRARADATEIARIRSVADPNPAQRAINRLIYEIEGGRTFVDEAKPLTADDVAASALANFRDAEPDAVTGASSGPPPEPEIEPSLKIVMACGAAAAIIIVAVIVRVRKRLA